MTDPFDGWSVATKIESPAHVHAFGMIAMNAAIMEEVLTLLLAHFLRLPQDISIPLVHKMAIGDSIRSYSKDSFREERRTEGIVGAYRFWIEVHSHPLGLRKYGQGFPKQ